MKRNKQKITHGFNSAVVATAEDSSPGNPFAATAAETKCHAVNFRSGLKYS